MSSPNRHPKDHDSKGCRPSPSDVSVRGEEFVVGSFRANRFAVRVGRRPSRSQNGIGADDIAPDIARTRGPRQCFSSP